MTAPGSKRTPGEDGGQSPVPREERGVGARVTSSAAGRAVDAPMTVAVAARSAEPGPAARAPHEGQNRAPEGTSVVQLGQAGTAGFYRRRRRRGAVMRCCATLDA